MTEITIKGYQCERCGHKWVPREEERPRVCPKCKSAYWDKARRSKTIQKKFDRIDRERLR